MPRRPLRRALTLALAAGLLASPLVAVAEPPASREPGPEPLTSTAPPAVHLPTPSPAAPSAVRAADLAAAADRGADWLTAQATRGQLTTDELALTVIALAAAGPEHDADRQRLTTQLEGRAAAARSDFWGSHPGTVYLATGQNWPDGLTGGAAAAYGQDLLMLTKKEEVPGAVLQGLRDRAPSRIVVLGGTGAVSSDVIGQLRAELDPRGTGTPRIERIDGKDRYAVAAGVAKRIPATEPLAFVATGRNWPDALAGGALAGQLYAPLLLVQPTTVPTTTRETLQQRRPDYVGAFGGPAAVLPAALSQVRLIDTDG